MDYADEREAFLKAIFDAPADDLPRLVFADWLDEHGNPDWAELIRRQCHRPRQPHAFERELELTDRVYPSRRDEQGRIVDRGFRHPPKLAIGADQLGDPAQLRRSALYFHPEWYGATELKITGGLIQSGKPIQTILTSPVTARVTRLDLSGSLFGFDDAPIGDDPTDFGETTALALLHEYEYRPVVTVQAVEALVKAREARRLTHLDLRNNDLDNDAARAIVHSRNLIRLTSLQLFDGNQLRGRTWQQLLERFGPDVVQ